MANMEDIRWKQRFQNFEQSLKFLEQAVEIKNPSIVEKAGTIQFFEICFELSWKVLKDYLTEQGFADLKFPREIIKKAFEVNLIDDGQIWLEALANRNLTAHTYDEEVADRVVRDIKGKYYPELMTLHQSLKKSL